RRSWREYCYDQYCLKLLGEPRMKWQFWFVSLPALGSLGWIIGAFVGAIGAMGWASSGYRVMAGSGPGVLEFGLTAWIGAAVGVLLAVAIEFGLNSRGSGSRTDAKEHLPENRPDAGDLQ